MIAQALLLVAAASPLASALEIDPAVPVPHEDVCLLPAETGTGRAAIPRFAFNPKTNSCEMFTWGGAGGNANNFVTKEECEAACPPIEDICLLPPATGECKGDFPRFYFNPETGTCDKFIWGGCGGNANNFETVKECEAECAPAPAPAPKPEDVCSLPIKKGPCLAFFPRYGFSNKLGRCVRFIYGGCKGNANRFLTLAACQKVCPSKP